MMLVGKIGEGKFLISNAKQIRKPIPREEIIKTIEQWKGYDLFAEGECDVITEIIINHKDRRIVLCSDKVVGSEIER